MVEFFNAHQPLIATALAILVLLVLVLRLRMHAFPALLVVSLFGAIIGGMAPQQAIQTVTQGMGSTLGFIAIVVGLGAMFGVFLEAGGGVQALSGWILKRTGLRKGRWSMGIIGLMVAIPVFFDVALIILVPIVFSLARRAKTAPLVFGLPLLAGLATAHAFIPPTPGPISVAILLNADLGWVILFGLLAGAPAMLIAGPLYTGFAERRGWLGSAPPDLNLQYSDEANDPSATSENPDSFDYSDRLARAAILTIAVPLVLILLATFAAAIVDEDGRNGPLMQGLMFIGHPFTALLIGCGAAYLAFRPNDEAGRTLYSKALSRALEPTGAVILITGAGGAFKQVLIDTGAGSALARAATSAGLTPIAAGFILALLVRAAQGSATVAMITAAGLTAPIAAAAQLNAPQTALVVIAIAAGGTALSHVNDSGFWLVNRYFGQTEAQTLRTWTVSASLVGGVGFMVALVLSVFV